MISRNDPRVRRLMEEASKSVSMIMGPDGMPISDTLQDEEGIVYADIDLAKCVVPKQFQDVVGYYNRFDVFDLKVNRRRLQPATFTNDEVSAPTREAGSATASLDAVVNLSSD